MDVTLNGAGNAVAAQIVRQFTPSRIEKQLPAQVFDLVCGQQCEVEESHSTARGAVAMHRVGDGGQALVAHVARRRAA